MDAYEVRQAAVIVSDTVRLVLSERLGELRAAEAFSGSLHLDQIIAFYRDGYHYAAERSGVWPFELCGIKKYCEEYLPGFAEGDALLGVAMPGASQLFHEAVINQIQAMEGVEHGR